MTAADEMSKREALDAYRAGRLTLREFARALALDTWAPQDLLASEGVAVAQGARSETLLALQQTLDELAGTG